MWYPCPSYCICGDPSHSNHHTAPAQNIWTCLFLLGSVLIPIFECAVSNLPVLRLWEFRMLTVPYIKTRPRILEGSILACPVARILYTRILTHVPRWTQRSALKCFLSFDPLKSSPTLSATCAVTSCRHCAACPSCSVPTAMVLPFFVFVFAVVEY